MDRGAKVTQQNDVSNSGTIVPDYPLQHMQAGSTFSCATCQRGGSMTEALNVGKKSVTTKDTKDQADLYDRMSCKIVNI